MREMKRDTQHRSTSFRRSLSTSSSTWKTGVSLLEEPVSSEDLNTSVCIDKKNQISGIIIVFYAAAAAFYANINLNSLMTLLNVLKERQGVR